MRVFLVLLLMTVSSFVHADQTVFSSLIECEKEPTRCIAYTEKELETTELYSFQWYHLKNLNLAAHWQIIDTEPLRNELPALANLDNAPAVFRVTVLTIYSKLLISEGELSLGREKINETIALIKDVNAVSLSPDRYAELVLLLNAANELHQAEAVGQELLGMFNQSRRNIELGDFYTALGHTQFHLGKYPQARQHYQAAFSSYSEMQHTLEMSNTQHNIARSYQASQHYELAIPHFEEALLLKAEAGQDSDPLNEQYTRLRFVESLYAAGSIQRAKQEFDKIKLQHLLDSYQPLYDKLKDSLRTAKN